MGSAGGPTTGAASGDGLPRRLAVEPARGFVGRDAERARLRDAIAGAIARAEPRVVLVAGEPGAGKTTLLTEVAREAHAAGCAVAYGRGEEGLETPYGLWREALGRAAWPSEATEREELFDAVLAHLTNATSTTPLVLVLDDLQWADQGSLQLLAKLMSTRPAAALAVLVAYRSTDVGAATALSALIASAAREPGVDRLSVPALDSADVEALVVTTIGRSLDDESRRLAERVRDDANGNAFFVTALLDEVGRAGAPSAGGSPTLRQVIAHRISRLGTEAGAVLRVAAATGEVFRLEIVTEAAGLPGDVVLAVVERAVADGLVSEAPYGAGFSFVHALVADALLADLGAPRRQRLHRAVAEVLLARGGDADAIASHLALADPTDRSGREKAVDAAVSAGLNALRHLAYDDAVLRLTDAVEMLDRWDLDEGRRCSALLALGRAQHRSGRADASLVTLRLSAELAVRLGRWDELARAVATFPVVPSLIPDPDVTATLERALATTPETESAARAIVASQLAMVLFRTPGRGRALRLAAEGVALAERSGDRVAQVFARSALLRVRMGDPDSAGQIRLADSILGLIGHQDDMAAYAVRHDVVFDLLKVGDLRRVDEETRRVRSVCERVRRPEMQFALLSWEAMRALLEGRLDVAQERSAAARAIGGIHGEGADAVALGQAVTVALLEGRLGDLCDVLSAAIRQFPHPGVEATLVTALAEAGRRTEARARLAAMAAEGLEHLPRDDVAMFGAVLLAEGCRVLDARTEAEALYGWLEPYTGQACVLGQGSFVCLGAADRSLGQLAASCGWADVARSHLADAARMNARMGARPFLALTRVEQAVLGVPGAAEEARAIAEELGLGSVHQRLQQLDPSCGENAAAELRAQGDVWTFTYADRTVQLKGLRGFSYLRELLARPGRELHVVELQGGGDSAGTPVLDERAKAAYRRRLEELEAELEEAEAFRDTERAARAAEGRQALAEELARAIGLGGRDRTMGSDVERARLNVSRALHLAVGRIAEHHPELGRHLELAVRTGTYCAYEPDPRLPVSWRL